MNMRSAKVMGKNKNPRARVPVICAGIAAAALICGVGLSMNGYFGGQPGIVASEVDLGGNGQGGIQINRDAYVDRVALVKNGDGTAKVEAFTEITEEMTALAESPAAVDTMLMPEASGVKVRKNTRAEIDYSNTGDGYVMVRFTGNSSKKLKVQVIGPTTTYTYDIKPGSSFSTFPLSDGNGSYRVVVYENTSGTMYATVLSVSTKVEVKDEFAPYLRPNQYVNYENAPNTVAKAKELVDGKEDFLDKVDAVYEFVVNGMTYDAQKAMNIQPGYLPELDKVLEAKTGICFDYASLMAGMLRSQGIPCKLVVGYAGSVYHAWISVYSEETGWIENAIFFDGSAWQRMDPTFASSGKSSAAILEYIGDGKNYTAKYLY